MQWSLYIQAVAKLQEADPAKPLSWFAISAIHGYPPDEQWEKAGPKTSGYGYCVHGLPHFPTWHRPYLALYEQALQEAALDVAKKYKTNTENWVQAALKLRSPYWDWADPVTYLPPRQVYDSVAYQKLRITTPEGPKDVTNPLLAYKFQRKINWNFQEPTTVRHPNPSPAQSIKAFEDTVKNLAAQGDLQFDCWKTLSWTTTWLEFSNQGVTQGQKANSLETLHGRIHVRTGGRGHMQDPIAAAFDPVFMLHHTNVDRQLSLWQALHPDVWISQRTEPQFVNRDLIPFWKNNNAFHRSTDDPVKNVIKFNATYPEFEGLDKLSASQTKDRIQAKVDALYDPKNRRRGIATSAASIAAASSAQPVALFAQAEVPQAEVRQAPVAKASATTPGFAPPRTAQTTQPGQAILAQAKQPAPAQAKQPAPAQAKQPAPAQAKQPAPPQALTALQRLDWFIRVRVKKFQLQQSFSILIFLGPAPENVAQWRSSPKLVGDHSEFVNSDPQHCANCRENADFISEGFIDLDNSLERLGYGQKTEEEIEQFIHDEVRWRIQKADGTVVPAKDLEVLEIAVMTLDVTDGDVDVRPVHRNLTSEKAGGRVPGQKPYSL
jgi:tyrosinase